MVQVGFEPTPPRRLELESSALDRSATEPSLDFRNNNVQYLINDGLTKKKIADKKIATNGIRTHDLSLTKRVLYQLSYSGVLQWFLHFDFINTPVCFCDSRRLSKKMENAGFDPAASSLRTTHSTD